MFFPEIRFETHAGLTDQQLRDEEVNEIAGMIASRLSEYVKKIIAQM